MRYATNAGYELSAFLAMLICWMVVEQRARAFYYLTAYGIVPYTIDAIKIAYHSPRPFWASPDVQAWGCSQEFGNPSGHAGVSMGLMLMGVFDIWSTFKVHVFWKVVMLLSGVIWTLSIGYSRLYLGVHGLNQVLLGWCIGTWFGFTWHFCVRESLLQYCVDLKFYKSYRLETLKCIGSCVAVLGSTTIWYLIWNEYIVLDPYWIQQ